MIVDDEVMKLVECVDDVLDGKEPVVPGKVLDLVELKKALVNYLGI